ncbi:hypothetical protein PPERSA_08333 [Pseudocohnilembus persalinus]|uniref:Uncharacterized protein n=1 Tax=Pseudocohnilembus persalinus TaxID=266149 RepID=A0A0V0QPF8_PSEPJ|nr:hypothetical protein PPERSA_08333 [Pseudocohnilembus persalinus]|eukprot:KRX04118.1 hypothetical protein PPERSA_08333 [Pseudocohnilembus persalinus]
MKQNKEYYYKKTPLDERQEIKMDIYFQEVFEAYINGEITYDEVMYVKNFPYLYQKMPQPKLEHLKELYRKKTENSEDGDNFSEYSDISTVKNAKNNKIKGATAYVDMSLFTVDLNKKLQTPLNQIKSGIRSREKSSFQFNSAQQNQNIKEKQERKQVGFSQQQQQDLERRQSIFPYDFQIKQSIYKSMTPSKRKQSENTENEGEFTNKNKKGGKISLAKLSKMQYFYVNEEPETDYQSLEIQTKKKAQKYNIDRALKKLRNVIWRNIELRKKKNEGKFSGGGGLLGSINAQVQKANQNQKQEDSKKSNTNPNQTLLEYKQNFKSKNFQNLALVHEKREKNEVPINEIKNGVGDNYNILRALYKKFFEENSEAFLESVKDPYHKYFRELIKHSDLEYDQFLNNYLNKKDIEDEKENAQKRNQTISKLKQYINQGVNNYGFRKYVPYREKIFTDQLGNLDSYTAKHMIESLVKFDLGQEQSLPQQKRKIKPIAMTRVDYQKSKQKNNDQNQLNEKQQQQQQNLAAKDNNNNNKNQKSQSQSLNQTLKSFNMSAQNNNNNNNTNNFNSTNNLNRQSQFLSTQNQLNRPSIKNQHVKSSLSLGQKMIKDFDFTSSKNGQRNGGSKIFSRLNISQQGNLKSNQSQKINGHVKNIGLLGKIVGSQNSNNIQSQEKEHKNKLKKQKKRGYFVIHRNQSLSALKSGAEQGALRDDSDESSDASLTEGKLERIYSRSINVQGKIKQNNTKDGLIRKVKLLIELEDLKRQAFETNTFKLENR